MIDPRRPAPFTDELFESAVRTVLKEGRGATSLLQRKFQIGYSRAARLIESMTRQGILGPHRGAGSRKVLITQKEWNRRQR